MIKLRLLFALSLLLPLGARAQSITQPASPASLSTVTATGGTASPSLATWFSYFPNPKGMFGAVGNGVTDDTAAITACLASRCWVPAGTYLTTIGQGSVVGLPLMGPGQVKTSDGNLRGPIVTEITAAPSSLGTWTSVLTAFNGDLSHVPWAQEHRITGTTTLTQPASGYVFTPETAARAEYFYNSSGWNQQTTGNDGRTGAVSHYMAATQAGQGDLILDLCSLTTTGAKAAATSFLANPAAACLAGTNFAGQDGVFLQYLGDMNLKDQGFDVAGALITSNLTRTNATGALGAFWAGERYQSNGTKPIDAFYSFNGPATKAIDMAGVTLTSISIGTIAATNNGASFAANDTITLTGGTCDQPPVLTVDTVTGGALTTFHTSQSGICSIAPSITPTWTTSGNGTGAAFSAVYYSGAAMTMPAGSIIYGHAANATSAKFPNATTLGVDGVIAFPTGGIYIGRGAQNMAGAAGANEIAIGYDHQAGGTNTVMEGQQCYDKFRSNTLCWAGGQFAARGDAERMEQILRRITSSTSATQLTTSGGSASSTNIVNIQTNTSFALRMMCQSRSTSGGSSGDTATWDDFHGTLSRVAGNAAYAGDATGATGPTRSTGTGSTATIQVSADTSNQGLNIAITAPNTDTWHTACDVVSLEVQ